MKKIVVFGVTNFSSLMKVYIEFSTDDKVCAFTIDKAYMPADGKWCGLPVCSTEELDSAYPPDEYEVLVAIGTSQMGDLRKKVAEDMKQRGYHLYSYTHPSACILADSIGEGNIFLENVVVQPFAVIGNCNLFWQYANVAHNCEIGDYNTLSACCSVAGFSKVRNNCFIGNNSTIKDSICIADYTLVGAGSYINRDTQPYQVYTPARSIVLQKKSTEYM